MHLKRRGSCSLCVSDSVNTLLCINWKVASNTSSCQIQNPREQIISSDSFSQFLAWERYLFPPCCYGSVLWLLFSLNCKCHRIWAQIVRASILSSIKIPNRLSAIKALAVLRLCQPHCIPACSQRAPTFSRLHHERLNIRLYNTRSQTAQSLPCIRHKCEHVNISVDGGDGQFNIFVQTEISQLNLKNGLPWKFVQISQSVEDEPCWLGWHFCILIPSPLTQALIR